MFTRRAKRLSRNVLYVWSTLNLFRTVNGIGLEAIATEVGYADGARRALVNNDKRGVVGGCDRSAGGRDRHLIVARSRSGVPIARAASTRRRRGRSTSASSTAAEAESKQEAEQKQHQLPG